MFSCLWFQTIESSPTEEGGDITITSATPEKAVEKGWAVTLVSCESLCYHSYLRPFISDVLSLNSYLRPVIYDHISQIISQICYLRPVVSYLFFQHTWTM